jgi:peroxiredoxin
MILDQHKILLLLLFIAYSTFSIGQGNTLLVGQIEHPIKDYLVVTIDKSYLDNRIVEEVLMLNEEGKFGLSCPLELPQKIRLTYNQKTVELFLAPEDTLILKIDGRLFPHGIKFEGSAAADNQLLKAFETEFPVDQNQFRYRQYRKGLHYYKVHEGQDQIMRAKSPVDYLKSLRKRQAEREAFVLSRSTTSTALRNYLQGELHYQTIYEQLAYGHIYKGRHGLDSSYFYFMDSMSYFNDQSLGNPNYRAFLMAWVNFQLEGEELPDSLRSEYAHQYYYAKNHLKGFSRYWLMSELLCTAMRKEDPEMVLGAYKDFLTDNPYREFDQRVMDAFQRTQQFAAGSPAPTFALEDIHGKTVSLRDFQGKLVYLDFWASWCKPCMKKLEAFKELEAAFEEKNIVFLHVNLDKSPQKWQAVLEQHQFGGIHLYNDRNSSITRDYEVLSVPKFFLITKEGNFAYVPPTSDLEKLAKAIQKLVD